MTTATPIYEGFCQDQECSTRLDWRLLMACACGRYLCAGCYFAPRHRYCDTADTADTAIIQERPQPPAATS